MKATIRLWIRTLGIIVAVSASVASLGWAAERQVGPTGSDPVTAYTMTIRTTSSLERQPDGVKGLVTEREEQVRLQFSRLHSMGAPRWMKVLMPLEDVRRVPLPFDLYLPLLVVFPALPDGYLQQGSTWAVQDVIGGDAVNLPSLNGMTAFEGPSPLSGNQVSQIRRSLQYRHEGFMTWNGKRTMRITFEGTLDTAGGIHRFHPGRATDGPGGTVRGIVLFDALEGRVVSAFASLSLTMACTREGQVTAVIDPGSAITLLGRSEEVTPVTWHTDQLITLDLEG